jgi:hypothetical protein
MKKQREPHVPQSVVSYLGRIAWTATAISGFLVWRLIETTAGADTTADAAVVGVLVAFIAVATGGTATLGAILASTRNGATPTPVTVENTPSDPVPTEPQGGTVTPAPVAEVAAEIPVQTDNRPRPGIDPPESVDQSPDVAFGEEEPA